MGSGEQAYTKISMRKDWHRKEIRYALLHTNQEGRYVLAYELVPTLDETVGLRHKGQVESVMVRGQVWKFHSRQLDLKHQQGNWQ